MQTWARHSIPNEGEALDMKGHSRGTVIGIAVITASAFEDQPHAHCIRLLSICCQRHARIASKRAVISLCGQMRKLRLRKGK